MQILVFKSSVSGYKSNGYTPTNIELSWKKPGFLIKSEEKAYYLSNKLHFRSNLNAESSSTYNSALIVISL